MGEYEKNKRSYAALVEKNVTVVTLPPQTEEEQKEIAPIKVYFYNLLKENDQVVGWLYCEGTLGWKLFSWRMHLQESESINEQNWIAFGKNFKSQHGLYVNE